MVKSETEVDMKKIIINMLILITLSVIFKESLYLNYEYFGIWVLLAAIIIFVCNKTIKPLLFIITLPITALTLGIFYPVINIVILKIVDVLLGKNFDIHGLLMSFIISILISIMNMTFNKTIKVIGGKYE